MYEDWGINQSAAELTDQPDTLINHLWPWTQQGPALSMTTTICRLWCASKVRKWTLNCVFEEPEGSAAECHLWTGDSYLNVWGLWVRKRRSWRQGGCCWLSRPFSSSSSCLCAELKFLCCLTLSLSCYCWWMELWCHHQGGAYRKWACPYVSCQSFDVTSEKKSFNSLYPKRSWWCENVTSMNWV